MTHPTTREVRILLATIVLFLLFCTRSQAQQGAAVAYGYIVTPEPTQATAEPRIIEIDLNTRELKSGGPIDIRVVTSPDVDGVVAGNGPRSGSLQRVRPGLFVSESTLPRGIGFLTMHFNLHITATAVDGSSTAVDVPVTYR